MRHVSIRARAGITPARASFRERARLSSLLTRKRGISARGRVRRYCRRSRGED